MCGAGGRGLNVDTEEGDGGTISIGRGVVGCDGCDCVCPCVSGLWKKKLIRVS
jgi:hypothetical protein